MERSTVFRGELMNLLEVVKKVGSKVRLKEPSVFLSDGKGVLDIGVGVVEVDLPSLVLGGSVYEVDLRVVSDLFSSVGGELQDSLSFSFSDNRGEIQAGNLKVVFPVLGRFFQMPVGVSFGDSEKEGVGPVLEALKKIVRFAVVAVGMFLWSRVILVEDDYAYYSSGAYVVRCYHGQKLGGRYVFVVDFLKEILSLFSSPRLFFVDNGWVLVEHLRRVFVSVLDFGPSDLDVYYVFPSHVEWAVVNFPLELRSRLKKLLAPFSPKDEVELNFSSAGSVLRVLNREGVQVEFSFDVNVVKEASFRFFVGVFDPLLDVVGRIGMSDGKIFIEDDDSMTQVVCSQVGELMRLGIEFTFQEVEQDG